MIKSAFIGNEFQLNRVYADGRKETVKEISDCYATILTSDNLAEHADNLKDVEVLFSTWGMPDLSDAELDMLPSLKAVFYAAGSVKGFAPTLLNRDITVMSSWCANAIPVAEFTLGQILLSLNNYFRNTANYQNPEAMGNSPTGPGIFAEKIALIGCGMIARHLIKLLKSFSVEVLVVDPYLPESQAQELGVTIVTMEEAFSQAYIISNHLPNLDSLIGVLNYDLFKRMREGATFINTGRGAQVCEDSLLKIMQERSDLTALLDVTHPEPPVAGSPLYNTPNIQLSTHIAGSNGNEVIRMADYAIEEFKRWENNEELKYSVSLEMLDKMA